MRTMRLTTLAILSLGVLILGCSGGNKTGETEAPVFLTVDIPSGPADVNISCTPDLTISQMTIKSQSKAPGMTLSVQDDAKLTDWVITPVRTDGGTVASPQWRNYYNVYVPAGGSASLTNYRIYPAEYYRQPPLNQLLPENAGYDKETGNRNIRQKLHIEIFGKTVAGAAVSVAFDITLNFTSSTPCGA
jgi:hypothetical protein